MRALILYFKELFISQPIRAWDWFWFSSKNDSDLWSISLFRILFSASMLFFYITRAFDVSDFYTEHGLLSRLYVPTMDFSKYHHSIFYYIENITLIHALHTFFLLLLLMLVVGLFTRPVSILVYILHLNFIFRNPTVMFGVDMIATFFFLYLPFTQAGARLSIDAWLRKRRQKNMLNHSSLSHIFLRLMQIQLCIIYAYAGLEKLKGTRWWDGSAIWDIFSMGTMQRWDFSFVAHIPVVISVMTYVVLFWEIFFPIMVWSKPLRPYVLAFGIALHVGIGVFMNLPSFAAMMMSIYALFIAGDKIKTVVEERSLANVLKVTH